MSTSKIDWHRVGCWAVFDPQGEGVDNTLSSTAYSARASAVRSLNRRWSLLDQQGYIITELVPRKDAVEKVNTDGYSVADESRWRYPANGEPAPQGAHVQLLTVGGKQVPGVWRDDGGFIAWAPNIKRDKELERRLGL